MANQIILKNKTTTPVGGQLSTGEPAVLTQIGTAGLYIGDSLGTSNLKIGTEFSTDGAELVNLTYATMRGASYLNVDVAGTVNYSHPNHTGQVTSVGDGAMTLANAAITDWSAPVGGIADADTMLLYDSSGTTLAETSMSALKTYINAAAGSFSNFTIRDGDGTDVQIDDAEYVQMIEGGGIDINWTDTSTGSTGDPYDMTFTLDITGLTGTITLAAADTFAVDDGDSGTLRKATMTELQTYMQNNLTFATGDITKVGTPANNEMAVWTGDGTLEGEPQLLFNRDATTTDQFTILPVSGLTSGDQLTVYNNEGATFTGNVVHINADNSLNNGTAMQIDQDANGNTLVVNSNFATGSTVAISANVFSTGADAFALDAQGNISISDGVLRLQERASPRMNDQASYGQIYNNNTGAGSIRWVDDGGTEFTLYSSYDRSTSVLSGANVFSDIIVVDGHVTGTATRALALTDLDANAAAYDDATANFTGDLQQGGSSVITAADIQDDDTFASASATAVASSESIKAYVDNVASGLDWKESVRAASTADVSTTFSAGQHTGAPDTLDGVSLAQGDRILLKDQSPGSENGIYEVTTLGTGSNGVWDRAADADNSPAGEVTSGMATFVEEGTTNNNTGWVMTTDGTITLNSTALVFAQFSGSGTYTASNGIELSGSDFRLDMSSFTPDTTPDGTDLIFGATSANVEKSFAINNMPLDGGAWS